MRMLKIDSGGRVFVEGELADLSKLEDKSEFLSSMLTLDVELGEGVSCVDLIHFFYNAKSLVRSVFSEEYEAVRALVSTTQLPKEYIGIRVYKKFRVELEDEQNFIYMTPEIEFIRATPEGSGINNIAGLPVYIDESIKFIHENTTIESKSKVTLFDLLTCLFDELPALIKDGALLLPE